SISTVSTSIMRGETEIEDVLILNDNKRQTSSSSRRKTINKKEKDN
ncbi:2985_t:CDS:2, partial [Diversispora eburnea]